MLHTDTVNLFQPASLACHHTQLIAVLHCAENRASWAVACTCLNACRRILQALPVGMTTAGLKKGMEQMKAEMDAYDKEHATDAPAGVEADTDTVPLV